MIINVRTVFKSENCGSYLQAWALKEQLSAMGNSVYFSDYFVQDNTWDVIRDVIKCALRFRFKRAQSILNKKFDYKKFQKEFAVLNHETPFDVCFFGSDTIWNFRNSFFENNALFFVGKDVEKPCYCYAVSAGSTDKEMFLKNKEIIKSIQKFKKIAVRDIHTETLLSEIYPGNNIFRTVDPTLLLNKDIYIKKFISKKCSLPKFLLVYYFGRIPDEIFKALSNFSRERNLKIVSVGYYEKTYDIFLSYSPSNFITAFANAEYVFTNTFHGCVFSTIFNKQFATDGIEKKKIEGFLEEFSLLDRVVTTADDVEKVMTTSVDYDKVNSLVSEARGRSIEYLQSVIDEVKGNE